MAFLHGKPSCNQSVIKADSPGGDGTCDDIALRAGADNLITGCLGDVSGKAVLLVIEDPAFGWYDEGAPLMVADRLRERGAVVKTLSVGPAQNCLDERLLTAMAGMDEVVFFSRIGDQNRFDTHHARPSSVMCYALDTKMLSSGYGRLDHHAMVKMKDAIGALTLQAKSIKITCPHGTCLEGNPAAAKSDCGEVVIRRFPIGIPQPVPAQGFKGVVALCRYLTATGSRIYSPNFLPLSGVVMAHVDGIQITDFRGPDNLVAEIRAHYLHVAEMFGIDPFVVSSWHAGIHPLMEYNKTITEDPARWSATVFSSPRTLHFHTCGVQPPGEICWMVVDPTITIDGAALWQDGRLYPERFPSTKTILDAAPECAAAYASPRTHIGLGKTNC